MRPAPKACRALLAATLLATLAPLACGPATEDAVRSDSPSHRVLMVGVDGLEWSVLRPLLEAGKCPNLAALMERGSYGKLGTFIPTHSPIVWTSIGTGKDRKQHGILGFVDQQQRVFTSSRRRTRALWNIAGEYGLTSNVIGWWITWPAEPIDGIMVSATSASAMITKNWKGALVPGVEDQVHPPEREGEVLAIALAAGEEEHIRRVAREKVFSGVPSADQLPSVEKELIDQTLWSVLSDETYFQVAKELLPRYPADLSMVYFGGPDVAGHRFWRHYQPHEYEYAGESPEADRALMCTIPNYYVWVDEMIGELVEAAGGLEGGDLVVMVMSDHGMHSNATTAPNRANTTGDHQDGAPGVLIAAGDGVIRRQGGVEQFLETGALPTLGNVYSITPDVLGILGIPTARDMNARAWKPLFTPEAWARIEALGLVDTHDEGFREPQIVELPKENENDFKERMAGLGYVLAAPDEDADELVRPDEFVLDPESGVHPCH